MSDFEKMAVTLVDCDSDNLIALVNDALAKGTNASDILNRHNQREHGPECQYGFSDLGSSRYKNYGIDPHSGQVVWQGFILHELPQGSSNWAIEN